MTEAEMREEAARAMRFEAVGRDSWPDEDEDVRSPYRELSRPALAIAIPWARERALREAAAAVERMERDHFDAVGDRRRPQFEPYYADAVLALISSRPSQETTDE